MKGVGLALGGGAAKGYAHIGILRELERQNIPITSISGVSAGSIIAALYACGVSPSELETIALKTDWTKHIEFTAPKAGFASLRKFSKVLDYYTDKKKFSQTKIPLRVTAVDIDSGEPFVFSKGRVTKAVMASIAMPAFFVPIKHKGKRLVDGGIIHPVPIDELRAIEDGNIVVAVDLTVPLSDRHDYSEKDGKFAKKIKKEFIYTQTEVLNEFLKLKKFRMPGPFFKMKNRLIDHFVEPERIYNLMNSYGVQEQTPEIIQILSKSLSIGRNELSNEKIKSADVIIKPKFVGIRAWEVERGKIGIREGERAARKVIPEIKKLIW
ncbi:MAG: hypothetical protein GY861_19410 [bacterium]|nr:hypothetical protein [bacterium]